MQMEQTEDYTIDLERIIKSRTGRNKVPRWVVGAANRFFHTDYINGFLSQGYEGIEFCHRCMEYMNVTIHTEGLEELKNKLPSDAGVTFVSNHPLGGVDGVALIGIIGSSFDREVRLLVNDFLMSVKGLAPMCVPVNKMGAQSRSLPEMMEGIYSGRNNLLIFPAGACSRVIDGEIQDRKWNKSFIKYSRDYNRWIVPVHFFGRNSPHFYRIDKLCRLFHIKFNLPMFYLPDELYRARGGSYRVVFGDPMPPESFDESRGCAQWADYVRDIVYKLE